MAFADPSTDFLDFYLEIVPEPEPDDLVESVTELTGDDHLFSRYARVSGLASPEQLRSARRLQNRILQSSGSRLNLSELLVMAGAVEPRKIKALEATFPFGDPDDPIKA